MRSLPNETKSEECIADVRVWGLQDVLHHARVGRVSAAREANAVGGKYVGWQEGRGTHSGKGLVRDWLEAGTSLCLIIKFVGQCLRIVAASSKGRT